MPLSWPLGVEAEVLTVDLEADVVRLVGVGLDARELAEDLLGRREVLHRVDHGLDAFCHRGTPLR
jgi:hypothetical protein